MMGVSDRGLAWWRGCWKGRAGAGVGGYRTSAPPSTFPARIWGTVGRRCMAP